MSSSDKWAETSQLYSNQASRLTELHGADLVAILKNDIVRAKTIVDVGCGTGAFAKAYIGQFPKGVPGQTLILSDLSSAMLDQARETVKIPSDFQTKLVFQEEDGTKLEGIADSSVDLVVSLFGVFLIPDQEATLKAIQRVLKKEDGTFANGSWMFGVSEELESQGFGVSLQDAFALPNNEIDPDHTKDLPFWNWNSKESIHNHLNDKGAKSIQTYQSLHNTVWEYENYWKMLVLNPMSLVKDETSDETLRARKVLEDFITKSGARLDEPLMFSTASILAVVRGFGTD